LPSIARGQFGQTPGWQGLCLKQWVDFEWRLRAAAGYAELGMNRESLAELNAIETPSKDRPEVLQLRLHHLMREKKWARALTVSRKLCRIAPTCSAGFLHAGFCLHELGKTLQAKKFLLKGPVALLREPIYYYNMGCYDALLGNPKSAQVHLLTSFKLDPSFRDIAKKDPDLETVRELI
jgi:Flp pilus assembly protein TadD